ncbi:antiholin [Salmonella enterica subsp. enterica serovar Mbandaka]|nr:antiholin [Escherichia coli]EAA6587069.1 antiholin [Salmonella enterica subsp. enterica serovar Typhimurium]EAB7885299.1 antiholin [Shigella boydii]ECB5941098.1 antiholin [Salmonella enterica subsp. enterica serovar Livingstone]EDI7505507.1 antiholin [Salmonella enterica subsp. enterica serovar Mbandaka]EEJ1186724.1 antiholin [Salmonella enterica]QTA28696.1 antiholin [Escherichia albertii]
MPDFFEHGCKIDAAERNRFRLSTPRGAQIYGTQAKAIIVNENPGSRRGYFWWLFKWID